jgi:hypothetical protein
MSPSLLKKRIFKPWECHHKLKGPPLHTLRKNFVNDVYTKKRPPQEASEEERPVKRMRNGRNWIVISDNVRATLQGLCRDFKIGDKMIASWLGIKNCSMVRHWRLGTITKMLPEYVLILNKNMKEITGQEVFNLEDLRDQPKFTVGNQSKRKYDSDRVPTDTTERAALHDSLTRAGLHSWTLSSLTRRYEATSYRYFEVKTNKALYRFFKAG